MENDHKASNKNKMEFKAPFEKSNLVGNSFSNNCFSKTHLKDTKSPESLMPINLPTNSSMTYSSHHNHGSSTFFVSHCNNSSLESTKKLVCAEYENSDSSEQIDAPSITNLEANKSWNNNIQELKSEKLVKNIPATSTPKQYILPDRTQTNSNLDLNRNESKTGEITDEKRHSLLSGLDSYRQHRTNGCHTNTLTQQSLFPAQKDNNGHLLYDYNSQAQHRTNYIDYTSHHSLKSVNVKTHYSTTEKNEEELSEDKPHNSIQLNTQPPNYNNPEAPASFINPSIGVHYPSRDIYGSSNSPSREIYDSSNSQYYGDVYDPNTIGAPANYPSQFGNYAAYSSYSHPHFRPPFHSNVQNTSSATISSNPYMTWPFMPSSAINEPCNAIYSTSYTQNSPHQYNQWHSQR